MTNEEVIKEIQDASDYEVRHGDIEHHYEDIMRRVEAFEKAVNALQKEPVYFPPCVDCNTKMNEIREAYDKLKNQEPCEDAVSRQAVDQNIYDYAESNGLSYANLKNAILDTPSVTPTPKWIPVSERLPEENGWYLVTVMGTCVTTALWVGNAWYWRKITAWMPLSEPYEERVGIE